MTGKTFAPPSGGRKFTRQLGRYGTGRDGPTLLVCGGLHGNEPAGPIAALRVIERLEATKPPLRGQFLALAGNLEALARDRRYLEFDLNRCWTDERLARLRGQDAADDLREDAEQRALLELIDEAEARATGPLSFLDLHTTSGRSAPFGLIGDTRRNRRLAFALPGPVILGLEETVDGTLLGYLEERGHASLVVEAGQHADPLAVDLHESVIWLTMASVGLLDADDIPDYAAFRARLAKATQGLPRVAEVRYRHGVEGGSGFSMKPGYDGFRIVEKGEVLAHDKDGEVRAPERGHLLMPLYQDQGNDGYYLVRPVKPFWLGLSSVLRRLRLHVLLRALPGVHRHPEVPRALRVSPKAARLFSVAIFHLFGYRRRKDEDGLLVFSRRRQA